MAYAPLRYEFNHRQQGKRGDGNAVSLPQNVLRAIDNTVKEETAMPFPYPEIVLRAINNTAKEETAMPFPYPEIVLRAIECHHRPNIHL